jgi:hypothetical protein
MSVVMCPTCEDYIDTDFEDYDFETGMCRRCIESKELIIREEE